MQGGKESIKKVRIVPLKHPGGLPDGDEVPAESWKRDEFGGQYDGEGIPSRRWSLNIVWRLRNAWRLRHKLWMKYYKQLITYHRVGARQWAVANNKPEVPASGLLCVSWGSDSVLGCMVSVTIWIWKFIFDCKFDCEFSVWMGHLHGSVLGTLKERLE